MYLFIYINPKKELLWLNSFKCEQLLDYIIIIYNDELLKKKCDLF